MDFFHPLTLGVVRRRAASLPGSDAQVASPRLAYDSWREGLEVGVGVEEEQPEAAVLEQLRAPAAPLRGAWLVLGEPGAGKSRLLAEWHARWLAALGPPGLGARVPILVRLREATEGDLALGGEALADRLAALAWPAVTAAVKGGGAAALATLPPRLFAPVWLLDGLDEAPLPAGEAGLWDRLASLPGDVVVTCRTAVFEAARRDVAGHVGKEWRILGLRPDEQPAFLARALEAEGFDASPAATTVASLNGNAALRPLAAVPLLLRLVAEAAGRLVLPHNRAGFYADATEALWARRLQGMSTLFDLAAERDAALTALARAMGLVTLEADATTLKAAGIVGELREALRRTGLLRFDARRQRAAFPHLTFQEYFLARAWLAEPFADVLDAHWADARCEEALGLLLALQWEAGRGSETEAALQRFVVGWRQRHAREPEVLWRIGRSPHAVALALLARAGVTPIDPLLGAGAAPLPVRKNILMRRHVPTSALDRLARDKALHEYVKNNPAMPVETLVALARDRDPPARMVAARNEATPRGTLADLAGDPEPGVRMMVAMNASTPMAVLTTLAHDPDLSVRTLVAQNAAITAELRQKLARDADPSIRRFVAWNKAASAQILTELAHDDAESVRSTVALHPAVPASLLRKLGGDCRASVRAGVGTNPVTPADVLRALARDQDASVRAAVGSNPALPVDLVTELALDHEEQVRIAVAASAATAADTLVQLSHDTPRVRDAVARNAATPAETLERLADDQDWRVRHSIAGNAMTPATTLSALVLDREEVRVGLSHNSATPPETLARLTRDITTNAAEGAAFNPSTLIEDLWLAPED